MHISPNIKKSVMQHSTEPLCQECTAITQLVHFRKHISSGYATKCHMPRSALELESSKHSNLKKLLPPWFSLMVEITL